MFFRKDMVSALRTLVFVFIVVETAQVTTRQGRVTMRSPSPAPQRRAAVSETTGLEGVFSGLECGSEKDVRRRRASVETTELTESIDGVSRSRRRSTRVATLASETSEMERAAMKASKLREGQPKGWDGETVPEDPVISHRGSVLISPPSPFKNDAQPEQKPFTLIAPPVPVTAGQHGLGSVRQRPDSSSGIEGPRLTRSRASKREPQPKVDVEPGNRAAQRNYVAPRARAYKQPEQIQQATQARGLQEDLREDDVQEEEEDVGSRAGTEMDGEEAGRLDRSMASHDGSAGPRRRQARRSTPNVDAETSNVKEGGASQAGAGPADERERGGGRYFLRSRAKTEAEEQKRSRDEGTSTQPLDRRRAEAAFDVAINGGREDARRAHEGAAQLAGSRREESARSAADAGRSREVRRDEGGRENRRTREEGSTNEGVTQRSGGEEARRGKDEVRSRHLRRPRDHAIPAREAAVAEPRPQQRPLKMMEQRLEQRLEQQPLDENREEVRAAERGGVRVRSEGAVPGGGRPRERAATSEPSSNDRIQVCVRKRPLSGKEQREGQLDVVRSAGGGANALSVLEYKRKLDLTEYVEQSDFAFDEVLGDEVSNEQVYTQTTRDLVSYVLSRKQGKATVFAYGQTGAGKTYTMMGGRGRPGLYLLASRDIFNMIAEEGREEVGVCVSFFEIYSGKLFDLLNNRQPLIKREDGRKNVCIRGLTEHPVGSAEELMRAIEWGHESRSTASTVANMDSSRSHAILQIGLREGSRREERGKLTFIDLAGSERSSDTGKTSDRTRRLEAADINKSLLALKECIRALAGNHSHIPFRGSLLTSVLKDSFVGDCRTVMIANVAPNDQSCEHTLNTLRYADRVKAIKLDARSERALSRHSLPPRPSSLPPSHDHRRRSNSESEEAPLANSGGGRSGAASMSGRSTAPPAGAGKPIWGGAKSGGDEEEVAEKIAAMHRKHIQETSQLLQKEREMLAQAQRKGQPSNSYLSSLGRLMEHKSGLVERMMAMLPFGAA